MFKEQELMLAQEAAGLAIWEWHADTNTMRWLPGSCSIFGRPPESLRTREDMLSCVIPEERERVAELRDAAVNVAGRYQVDYRVMWPNKELHWIRATARGIHHPERGKMLIGVSQDITADKKREEKLRAQARLLDLAHEPILVRNSSDKITFWNAGAERFYGYTREEACGTVSHELLQTKFPQPLSDIRRNVELDGMWEGELIHATKQGHLVRVQSRWLTFSTDAGLSILETNFDLAHQEALQTARVWEEKAHMLSEMAHEVNNPLSIAVNATHLLKRGCDDPHQEYIKMLEDAILRIAEFIRKTAALHRATARTTAIERKVH